MTTPNEIMICDGCAEPITDLSRAMIFWNGNHDPVDALRLAHKRCEGRTLRYSMELAWFADGWVALQRLGGLAIDYHWAEIPLRRLVSIAAAVPHFASTEDRERAQKTWRGI